MVLLGFLVGITPLAVCRGQLQQLPISSAFQSFLFIIMMLMKKIKVVVVGDQAVLKTRLLQRYVREDNPESPCPPTIFQNTVKTISVEGETIQLSLIDSAGQEPYAKLRAISYDDTDVFLIAFSLESKNSFLNAKEKWYREVTSAVPNCKVIFVGLRPSSDCEEEQDDASTESELPLALKSSLSEHYIYREVGLDEEESDSVDELFQLAGRLCLQTKWQAADSARRTGCGCFLI